MLLNVESRHLNMTENTCILVRFLLVLVGLDLLKLSNYMY